MLRISDNPDTPDAVRPTTTTGWTAPPQSRAGPSRRCTDIVGAVPRYRSDYLGPALTSTAIPITAEDGNVAFAEAPGEV